MNIYLGCVAPCNYFEYKVQTIDEDNNPELVSNLVLPHFIDFKEILLINDPCSLVRLKNQGYLCGTLRHMFSSKLKSW